MKKLTALLIMVAAQLSAQGVRLESFWSAETVLVGQPVDLHISAEVPENIVPHFTGLTLTNPDVSLDSTRFAPLSVTYSFTFWAVGEMSLPGIPVQLERPDGSIMSMSTDSLSIFVTSSLTGSEQDIREIKEMVPLSLVNAGSLWRRGIAVGVLIMAAILIWVRRRKGGSQESLWKRQHPGEAALGELDKLRQTVYHPYDAPEHYQRLSAIVRSYIGTRFVFRALEMTTSEIRDALPGKVDDPAISLLIAQLLQQCDLAKFARQKHAQNRWRNDLDMALRIINKTRPALTPQFGDL